MMAKTIFIIIILFSSVLLYAVASTACNYVDVLIGKGPRLNINTPTLNKLIDAMIVVESNGDDNAIGRHGEVGCLQIKEILVKDVNRIISKTPSLIHKDLFSIHDRYNRAKSIEMCRIYVLYYGQTATNDMSDPTLEMCARIWNGGPNGWKLESTEKYWKKVQKAMR